MIYRKNKKSISEKSETSEGLFLWNLGTSNWPFEQRTIPFAEESRAQEEQAARLTRHRFQPPRPEQRLTSTIHQRIDPEVLE